MFPASSLMSSRASILYDWTLLLIWGLLDLWGCQINGLLQMVLLLSIISEKCLSFKNKHAHRNVMHCHPFLWIGFLLQSKGSELIWTTMFNVPDCLNFFQSSCPFVTALEKALATLCYVILSKIVRRKFSLIKRRGAEENKTCKITLRPAFLAPQMVSCQ